MEILLVIIVVVLLVNSAWLLAKLDKIITLLNAIHEELKSEKKEKK